MLSRKDFFLYNVIISCLILFFPLYEVLLSQKIVYFIYFDICNIKNFCIYYFILYFNTNLIYLFMDADKITYLEASFNKFKILREKENTLDLLFFFYFFRLKFNEFLFFVKVLLKNKILYTKSCLIRYNFLFFFNINL